jgi:hypothetical protein
VKIAFDECIPIQMFEAFRALAQSDGFRHEIVSAREYRPIDEKGDAGWVVRFATDDGRVVVSGDTAMRRNVMERLALARAGLITFFFEPRWGTKNGYVKAAMLMNWWPKIEDQLATAEPGQCWEIPFQWNWTSLRDVTARPDLDIQRVRPKDRKGGS